jgi:hypothetical protein
MKAIKGQKGCNFTTFAASYDISSKNDSFNVFLTQTVQYGNVPFHQPGMSSLKIISLKFKLSCVVVDEKLLQSGINVMSNEGKSVAR